MQLSPGHHGGSISDCRILPGFALTETQYAPGTHIPNHSHERGCFALILDGSYTETFRTSELRCVPATVAYRPPGEPHRDQVSSDGSRCFLIEVEISWLQGLLQHGVNFDGPILSGAPRAYWLAKKVHDEFASAGDEVCALSIHGLTLALAAALTRASIQGSSGDVSRWFRDVVDLLQSRYTEKLTLTFLADTAGVHPVYLAAAFRRHLGITIGAYVRQLRIEQACREMLRPEGFRDCSTYQSTVIPSQPFVKPSFRLAQTPPDRARGLASLIATNRLFSNSLLFLFIGSSQLKL